MGISSDFIMGFLVAASAFITVAGIVLAFGSSSGRLGRIAAASLIISLALGTALIVTTLAWLDKAPASGQAGWILLTLQLMAFYFPMWQLAALLSRK